jgi:hypothetical protein
LTLCMLVYVPYHSSVVQVHSMLSHLVRFDDTLSNASEMIPLSLRCVKGFFTKFLTVRKFGFTNALRLA